MIRSVAPGDLWSLRRKPRNQVVLYNDTLLVEPHQPFWFALRCFMEGSGHDLGMSVFHERGIRAYVQAKGRRGRPEQDIIYLAAHGSRRPTLPSDYDIWYRLLEHQCTMAGHSSIQRIYATIWDHQREVHEIFRQLGFQAYVRRVVLQLAGPDWDQGTRLAEMRPQSRQDSWAIHRLYGAVAPHLVQRAEVRTARSWTLPLTQRWQRQRQRSWVLGADDELDAYLTTRQGRNAHVLRLLIDPVIREQAPDVLRFGLAQINDDKPVYLLLAEYQSELLNAAQNLGFQPVGDQIALLKSTTIPVRKSVLLSAFEPNLEPPRISVPHNSIPGEDAHAHGRITRQTKRDHE